MAKRATKKLVFISHSSKDTWVAARIAQGVKQCGAEAFLDETDIGVGDDFEDRIHSFIRKADELVVLITPWALQRPYVWLELGAAWGRKIRVVGLLHGVTAEELQSNPTFPLYLKKPNLLPLNDVDRYFAELSKRNKSDSRRLR